MRTKAKAAIIAVLAIGTMIIVGIAGGAAMLAYASIGGTAGVIAGIGAFLIAAKGTSMILTVLSNLIFA